MKNWQDSACYLISTGKKIKITHHFMCLWAMQDTQQKVQFGIIWVPFRIVEHMAYYRNINQLHHEANINSLYIHINVYIYSVCTCYYSEELLCKQVKYTSIFP